MHLRDFRENGEEEIFGKASVCFDVVFFEVTDIN